jgi:hypothetical protein
MRSPPPRRIESAKHWAGYGWFMSFGTLLPLLVFLGSYLVHVTLVGAPFARIGYRIGIWLSTFGQKPPRLKRREPPPERPEGETEKTSFAERVRAYAPGGIVERRGRPVPLLVRSLWFVLVGWWLGAVWVVIAWSVFLAPYPFLDTVATLLEELPGVMTLAPVRAAATAESAPRAT